jgi:hypothetical protein
MWILILVALLSLIGSLFQPGGIILSVLCTALYFFFRSQARKREDFLLWLFENIEMINSGQGNYQGITIKPDTKITYYQVSLSFMIVSMKVSSKFFFIGHDDSPGIALIYTVVSLVLGWWGIPWGPIYTIQVIYNNMSGGNRQNVAELIETARKPLS